MQKKYVILQDGLKECGSACLLSIIRYYNGFISLDRLLELTKTNKDGTNFYNLSLAAKEIGFDSKGYKIDDISKLEEIESPFISQIIINNYNHFVVVYKIKNNKMTIMDPAKGMINISLDKFKSMYTGYILILKPYKKLPIYNESNYLLNIIKETLFNNKNIIIKLLSFTLIITIMTCIYSYHFKIIIDNVINTNKLNLLVVTIIFILVLFIKKISEYLRNNLLLYLEQKLDLSIITKTINKIINLPYSYYKNRQTGEIISRVNDLFYIKNVISKVIITLFLDNILSIIILIILFTINKTMTLLLLLITIIYITIFLVYKGSIKNITDTIQEDNAKVNSLLVESISSYETIKGLNLEDSFTKKINKQYLNTINNNLSLSRIINQENLLKDLFEGIILLFIIYLGCNYIMDKSLTIGSLLTYNTLLSYYLIPIKNSLDFYKELFYVKNSIKRINNILNYKYELVGKKSDLFLDGDIKINNLSFSYSYKFNILNNISLNLPKKSKTLILGSSGSGKSTLLKILYKYYEIDMGKIYIGNYDLNDYTIKDIRENITYISQNELLYTDTIKNNIILDREVSDEDFLKVVNLTCVSEMVKDNMLSYDYQLEEYGANLSGGQRQRIVLARSLLKNAKIILIDEGLNEIDINLERKILKNIFKYYQDKMFIIISHRKDNMDLYDNVISLDKGIVKDVLNKNV
ncbi:MAG: peptidase domain-containing ABC transporter [Bacilli bacterium]|nr:peptidase domain-containing ABC transporter [Bacilli bacterium]